MVKMDVKDLTCIHLTAYVVHNPDLCCFLVICYSNICFNNAYLVSESVMQSVIE